MAGKGEPQASIFDEIEVVTKAGTFTFREIDGDEYDKIIELSSDPKTKTVDSVSLLRWLAAKSAVGDNALDMTKLNKLPYSARVKVLTEVNSLYFPESLSDLAERLKAAGWTVEPPKEDDSGKD